jgi:hypothetical protein
MSYRDEICSVNTLYEGPSYTCDFEYELPYDSVCNFLHEVVFNLMFDRFFLKFVYNRM